MVKVSSTGKVIKEKVIPKRREAKGNDRVSIPVGMKRPKTLHEQISEVLRSSRIRAEFDNAGIETFEEADDFDVGDDFDPATPYEMHFDSDLGKEITNEEKAYVDEGRKKFDASVQQAKKRVVKKTEPEVKKKPKVKKRVIEVLEDDDEE